ncbi:MAG: hypothetical protein F6K09_09645 [Merismopedia sp. SIO2A8]|nr:hypothetical protein [Merismopedia sp. SIO2A8]
MPIDATFEATDDTLARDNKICFAPHPNGYSTNEVCDRHKAGIPLKVAIIQNLQMQSSTGRLASLAFYCMWSIHPNVWQN